MDVAGDDDDVITDVAFVVDVVDDDIDVDVVVVALIF